MIVPVQVLSCMLILIHSHAQRTRYQAIENHHLFMRMFCFGLLVTFGLKEATRRASDPEKLYSNFCLPAGPIRIVYWAAGSGDEP